MKPEQKQRRLEILNYVVEKVSWRIGVAVIAAWAVILYHSIGKWVS